MMDQQTKEIDIRQNLRQWQFETHWVGTRQARRQMFAAGALSLLSIFATQSEILHPSVTSSMCAKPPVLYGVPIPCSDIAYPVRAGGMIVGSGILLVFTAMSVNPWRHRRKDLKEFLKRERKKQEKRLKQKGPA